jgi:beta-lactamase regulating signal transducer with metallopeptidase domain
MFALRGLAVSLSVFMMVYCVLSLAVPISWRTVCRWTKNYPAQRTADLLFALRMLPLAVAAAVTAALTIPSFLLLEPRAVDEPLGAVPMILGLFAVVAVICGIINVLIALRRTARTVSDWTSGAESLQLSHSLPVLRISLPIPPMTAVGIVHPRILLSSSAEFLLTPSELKTALNHEIAHFHRRDNLKKLVMCLVPFPGMGGLETAWLDAAEMAADDAAVSTACEALDLASALIKLSRLAPFGRAPELSVALVHANGFILNTRVERLIAWDSDRQGATRGFVPWYGLAAAVATTAGIVLTYSHLLARVHTATEWLVR